MKTGGRRAPDVREGGGDGDGYGRVAVVASGGQRRREAATPKATSMTIGAAAAANDGDSGRQRAAPAMHAVGGSPPWRL